MGRSKLARAGGGEAAQVDEVLEFLGYPPCDGGEGSCGVVIHGAKLGAVARRRQACDVMVACVCSSGACITGLDRGAMIHFSHEAVMNNIGGAPA